MAEQLPNQNQNNPTNIPINTPNNKSFSDRMAEIDKLQAALQNPGATLPKNPTSPSINPLNSPATSTPIYENNPNSGENFLTYLFSQQITYIILGIIAVLVIGGIIYYFSAIGNKGTVEITFNQVPDTVTIANEAYTPSEKITLQLKAGNHNIQANKQNYYPLNTSIQVQAKINNQVNLELIPYPQPQELVEYPSSFPHLNSQEDAIYYLSNYGTTFYKYNLNNSTKDTLSPNYFYHIDNVVWAPSTRAAGIITSTNDPDIHSYQSENVLYQKTRDEGETIFHFYDFSKYDLITQNHFTYNEKVKNPTWHPTKEEIVFHYLDTETGENSLSKANPNDIEKRERLLDINFNNALPIYSPDKEMIAIIDLEPSSNQSSPIYLYHTVSGSFDKIPTKDTYTNLIWSPDSSKIIGIKENSKTALIDIASAQTKDLPFKAGLGRMAWLHDNQRIILSIKQNNDSDDSFVIFDINANSGTNLDYMPPSKKISSISDLIVNKDDTMLYFTGDTHLYSLPLHLSPITSSPQENQNNNDEEEVNVE